MSRARIASATVVTVALAVAWCLWPSGDPDAPTPHAEALPTTTASSTGLTPAAAPLANVTEAPRADLRNADWWTDVLTSDEPGPQIAADDDPRAVVLRGRLTVRQQPWMHPAGVEVRVTRSWLDSVVPLETAPEARVPQRNEPRTRTDHEGRFAFRLVPAATEMFFLIGHDTEWSDYQKVPKVPRAGEELDLGDVFLDQRGSIVGRVEGVGAGATVRAVDDPLLDGRAGFEELQVARAEGAELFRVPGALRGSAVPDWVVRRDRYLPFPKTVTDALGNFRIDGVRPGNHDVFVVGQRGDTVGKSLGILVAPGRVTEIGAIRMRGGNHLGLTFVDDQRRPWVGAGVAFVHESVGFGNVAVRTDTRGQIRAVVPETPRCTLLFSLPDGGPWVPVEWNGDSGEVIVVPRPDEVVVMLAAANGAGLSGGKVRFFVGVQAFRPVDRELPAALQPREREPGCYVGRLPCPVVAVASAPGCAPAIAPIRDPGVVVMNLLPLQQMTVRVHDVQDQPVADALVRAQVHANKDMDFPGAQWEALANDRVVVGRTDERGLLTVPVWPTFFSFQASHPDYAASAGPKVMAYAGSSYDLLLRGGSSIVGTLTLEMRPAPAGMRIRARQKPPHGHPLAESGFLDERLAVTGDDGGFHFRQLVAGTWELAPELAAVPSPRGGHAKETWQPRIFDLIEGQELHVLLPWQQDHTQPAHIVGVVTQNGAPLGGALVRLRELPSGDVKQRNERREKLRQRLGDEALRMLGETESMPWVARFQTDAFGDFRFRDLRADTEYELRLDVPCNGRLQFVDRRVVRAGSMTTPARVAFAVQTGAAQLQCNRATEPFANRMLRLRQVLADGSEGARFELLLDAGGQSYVDGLPLGTWTVEPIHGGACSPDTFELSNSLVLVQLEVKHTRAR